jgi:hypothetical protein
METKAKLTLSDVLLITVYWVTFFTILFFIL